MFTHRGNLLADVFLKRSEREFGQPSPLFSRYSQSPLFSVPVILQIALGYTQQLPITRSAGALGSLQSPAAVPVQESCPNPTR